MIPGQRGISCGQLLIGGVANNFFQSSQTKQAKKRTKQLHEAVADCHRRLYPGMAVPKVQVPLQCDPRQTEEAMPTNLMMAYIVFMVSHEKRYCRSPGAVSAETAIFFAW